METFLSKFIGNDVAFWIALATSIVGTFSLIAVKTPNTVDNKILQFIMDAINFLGANLGKSKNGDV
jgi:hypothetical protein